MNKIPVGQTIAYAYGFTFGHLGTVIGLSWLPLLAAQVLNYFLYDLAGTFAAGDPAAMRANPALMGRTIAVGLIGYLITMFFTAVVAVALVRQALGLRGGGAIVHMAAGHDEWRMFGGHLRYFFAMIGVFLISYFILFFIGLAGGFLSTALASQPAAVALIGILVAAGGIAIYCMAIFTLVRMGYLLSPSIVGEAGGGIKRSYELTKGNFWRIVGVWSVACLPLLLVLGAAEYALIAPHFDIDFTNLPKTPAEVQAFAARLDASMAQVNAEVVRQWLPLQAMGFVYSVLSCGLFYSAAAFSYRALVPAGGTR